MVLTGPYSKSLSSLCTIRPLLDLGAIFDSFFEFLSFGRIHIARRTSLTKHHAPQIARRTSLTMSGAEAIVGVAAAGVGFLSLAIQLADSAKRLKSFYDAVKNAPESLEELAFSLKTMSILMEQLERHRQQATGDSALLMRCLEGFRRGTRRVKGTVEKIERCIARSSKIGRAYAAIKERDTVTMLNKLERAKSSLQLAFSMYYAGQQGTQLALVSAATTDVSSQLSLLIQNTGLRQ
jgi:hypothetical protein